MDTLAVRLAVPLIGPAKVFHLLGLRPAGRTIKKPGLEFQPNFNQMVRCLNPLFFYVARLIEISAIIPPAL